MWHNHEEARREGFPTLQAFQEYVNENGANLDARLARIEFKLLSVDRTLAKHFIARATSTMVTGV